MASMTTTLDEYQSNGDSKVWTLPTHTALDPFLFIQKRKAPSNPNANLESITSIVKQTRDAEGLVLAARDLIEIKSKSPKQGTTADMTAVLALAREYVASDEFEAFVFGQSWAS